MEYVHRFQPKPQILKEIVSCIICDTKNFEKNRIRSGKTNQLPDQPCRSAMLCERAQGNVQAAQPPGYCTCDSSRPQNWISAAKLVKTLISLNS